MDGSFPLTLQIILTVLAGIAAQVVAAYFKVPSIVFLLVFGIALGRNGLDLLHPQQLGSGLEVIVALAVAIILFEGGLNLSLQELRQVSGSLRNLVTLGALVTWIGGSLAAHYLSEFPWTLSFLYGSLVVVTGPTVVGPLIKQVQVEKSVATILEGEGVLIDPVGAILAVVVLETIFDTNATVEIDVLEIAGGLLLRLGIGLGIGLLGGWLLSTFLKRAQFLTNEVSSLVVLAGVWGIFGGSQLTMAESGLMATVATGMFLNSSDLPDERLLRQFKEKLTILCVSVLFILLAADLSLKSLLALGWGSVGTVLTLMLVIRPLSVLLCTWKSGLSWQQKCFIAWISPRGIVSASVASLFAILLTQEGISGGDAIKALVFLTIIMTVFLQGLTARSLAYRLGLTQTQATGAVILGCTPLSRLIAHLFQSQEEAVIIIDTDEQECQKAEAEGIRVARTGAFDGKALKELGIGAIGHFLALTANGEVNFVLAQWILEEFNPPQVWAVVPPAPETPPPKTKSIQTFCEPPRLATWNRYLLEDQVKLGKTTFQDATLSLQQAHFQALVRSGELLPLLVKRQGNLQIVSDAYLGLPGDELYYLLHDPRPTLLKRLSGAKPSTRLVLGGLLEVEEVTLMASTLSLET
ncbi:MAG: cation:proton antiporter [Merismopediaceae bacterium]|nr:cation:proton antiporter [Merismopediaceae bacterium]